MPQRWKTLAHVLRDRARDTPDAPAFTFVGRDGDTTWSYGELHRAASGVAARIQQDLHRGDRVLLLYPQGLDYLAALFGCMYADVLAVPLQPPGSHRAKQAIAKLEAIVADGKVAMVCTVGALEAELHGAFDEVEGLAELTWLRTDEVPPSSDTPDITQITPDALAYLQYTSGSTSTPKGVMVSHDNLLYNLETFALDYGHDDDSVMVSWLPTFHDLGLVYGVFMPLWAGFRGVLVDPLGFLRRPLTWLDAISRYRGTHAPAPNFAFDLCVAKIDAETRKSLDLRCWKIALNGAEPIRKETEARFIEAFGPCGVQWSTFSHAYGMSESTAVISKEAVGTPPRFLTVDGAALDRHEVVPVEHDAEDARVIAGCGVPVLDTTVAIVEPETLETLPEDRVGEIWVGGPTRAQGYWNQPEASVATFLASTSDTGEGPYLRTGDLGFVRDGHVYVTGRLKDLVIIRGENHYPQDIEWSVQHATTCVRPSCVAAFAIEREGGEGLAIVAEVYPEKLTDPEGTFADIRAAVAEHGLHPDVIALIQPRAIFKTSSGKIMRNRTREALLDETLEELARWEGHTPPPAQEAPQDEEGAEDLTTVDGLVAHIQKRAAALLGVADPSIVEPDVPVRELGFDSMQTVELAEVLSADLNRPLPDTVLFDHPTAHALATFLLGVEEVPEEAAPDDGLDEASDDELAAMLAAELDDLDEPTET